MLSDELREQITETLNEHAWVLFMKGVPEQPMCGFSAQVVQILKHLGISFVGINILENDELRQGMKELSNWPTFPQVYHKGELIGGCDIIREMFQSGELKELTDEQEEAVNSNA